ncbi:uncharacterized protein LOC115812585 [Chanos chanos]|uniref:Uncharacterized protein LOC115812585 n=1 Tax=Chanos chanos TaxID=29144 RepID=A0A6J2VI15_CHACN|nr:uncharacterized protein LOC115812585 [Chanos chanos]
MEEVRRSTGGARGSNEAVSTSSEFTHLAIVHLIEAMQRRWDVYGSRDRSRLFQSVQEELESLGHSLPVERIRRKWNNLIVTYKRVRERCRGNSQAKTSWEYFEMMDNIFGKTKIAQASPASATLLGFATTAKAAARTEERPSKNVPVAAVATSCLFPNGLITTSSQIPTLVPSPLLCTIAQKSNISPPSSTSATLPSVSTKPATTASRLPLRRRLKRSQLSSTTSLLAQHHGHSEKRTALLHNFLTGQEERARLDEQRQNKIDARERRKEKSVAKMADSLGRMATALELISSKQDTIIALLQRLTDKY